MGIGCTSILLIGYSQADADYLLASTYVDLAFIPWDTALMNMIPDLDERAKRLYPNYSAWHARVCARPSVETVTRLRQEAMVVKS